MAKRTFYVALGVPRGVDPESIRVAYRKVVSRYREVMKAIEDADEPSRPPPEEIEGYAVMRTYSERRHTGRFASPEPLIPTHGETDVDRYFDGFIPEVIAPPPRAQKKGKDLFVELRLVADEAQRGGLFSVHIPVMRDCPSCGDHEEPQQLACKQCKGSRRVTEDRTVDVTAPPGLQHGDSARIPMEDVGIEHTDLIVRVIVQ
jgi:hypothetical protein